MQLSSRWQSYKNCNFIWKQNKTIPHICYVLAHHRLCYNIFVVACVVYSSRYKKSLQLWRVSMRMHLRKEFYRQSSICSRLYASTCVIAELQMCRMSVKKKWLKGDQNMSTYLHWIWRNDGIMLFEGGAW